MGLNLDLIQMLNAPTHVVCPKCGADVDPGFYEYDVDDAKCNPAPGVWSLSCYCYDCGHEWEHKFEVVAVEARQDTAHVGPWTTVRACLDCGVLITGGPTRCRYCAEKLGK